MGLFDTIHLKKPLVCAECGAKEFSLQTKEFGRTMSDYRVGSIVRGASVLTGIVKETRWCSACHQAKQHGESPLFLIVWHSVLAGVEQDLARAEALLAGIDRLALIDWLDEAQQEARRWRRKYHALYSDIERWHAHLAEKDSAAVEAEPSRAFRILIGLPEEILAAADPLAAIIERNKPKAEPIGGVFD
jgi:hypothetical protein